MRSYRSWSVFSSLILVAGILFCFSARAVVNVDKTRVVFNERDRAQSITVFNSGVNETFLQLWTDDGDPDLSPDNSITPVLVLPPVVRILPEEMRSLRLMLTSRQSLPADRESLYWLNIYQVPALKREGNAVQRRVVLPLRIRLKIFIRPAGLNAPGTADPEKLRFTVTGDTLTLTNPTPWFMSLNVQPQGQPTIKNLMVAPLSTLQLENHGGLTPGDSVRYAVINDQGMPVNYTTTLM